MRGAAQRLLPHLFSSSLSAPAAATASPSTSLLQQCSVSQLATYASKASTKKASSSVATASPQSPPSIPQATVDAIPGITQPRQVSCCCRVWGREERRGLLAQTINPFAHNTGLPE